MRPVDVFLVFGLLNARGSVKLPIIEDSKKIEELKRKPEKENQPLD